MSDFAFEDASSRRTSRGRIRTFDAAVLVLLMLAIWQAIGSWTHGVAVSPPLQTLLYLFDLVRTGMFWQHAAATLAAFLLAFVLSALIGLALGLIFGLGMSAKVAFGVMHGLVPMTLFTLGAVRNLPPVLIRTAKVLRLSPGRTMLWVLVPACLPDIVNGLRISFSLSMLGVLIGEMFSSQRGLGFLLVSGMAQHNVPLSTAVVTVIVLIAIAANTLMLRLGKRIAHRSK